MTAVLVGVWSYCIDTDAIVILEVFAKKDRSYAQSRDRDVP
jgi:hypothetical protein